MKDMHVLPEKVERLAEYKPITTAYRVRLDANESPFTPSAGLLERFADLTRGIAYNRYPDPTAGELLRAYGAFIGVDPDRLTAGNGSDELISLICTAFMPKGGRAVICAPDFSMYEFYCGIAEAECVRYVKGEDHAIDFADLLTVVREKPTSLVILSNPCNPTSIGYDRETILDFVRSTGCLTVIDEAYMEFSPTDDSVLGCIDEYENLLVLKTLSKLGLAALRCGFAAGCEKLTSALRKVKSPYNVSSLTQALATAALTDGYEDEFRAHIAEIKAGTRRLYDELAKLAPANGYKINLPHTNFVALRFSAPEMPSHIFERLHDRSISIRYMKPSLLRVTCGTNEENEEFLAEFKALLSK